MDSKDVNWIFYAIVVVAMIVGPLVERWMKRRREREAAGAPPEPEPQEQAPEPMLPYEDLVEQVFGGYIERRKKEFRERMQAEAVEEIVLEAEAPRPPAAVAKPKVEEPPKISVTLKAAPRPTLTLEERLFGGRRLSPAARLVLAAEILQRPRSLRRGR